MKKYRAKVEIKEIYSGYITIDAEDEEELKDIFEMYESLGDEVPSSDLEYESGKSISRPDPMYCEFECTEYEEIKDNE